MTAKELKASILDLAVRGKLVPQDPNDEPAEKLLARIAAEKAKLVQSGKLKKDKQLPPITDDDKPFDLPSGWVWCRLGEVITFLTSGSRDWAKFYSSNEKDPLFLRMGNLSKDSFSLRMDDVKHVKAPSNAEGTRTSVHAGDLLFSITADIGLLGLIPEEFPEAYINQHTALIRFVAELKSRYIPYYLLSTVSRQQYKRTEHGIKNSFRLDSIPGILLPLPPLAEQKRIVEKIEQLMPLVERYGQAEEQRRQLITALPEALKKSILKSAVEGKLVPQDPNDEPAEKLLARIAAEKAKLIKSGKLKKEKPLPPIADDEKPFALPRGWVWCRFGDLVQTVTGKTPPRAENEWWRNDVPWVAIADMKDGCILTQTKEGVSRKAVETIFQGRVSVAGTLLMSFKLTIGKVAILGLDAVHNEAIISIYPYLDVDQCIRNYLFRILPFVVGWGKSKDAIKGSTLNATSIANLLIPFPPLVEQKRIVARVEELFGMIAAIK